MASGVKVSEECSLEYQSLKMKCRGTENKKFVALKFTDDCSKIIVDKTLDGKKKSTLGQCVLGSSTPPSSAAEPSASAAEEDQDLHDLRKNLPEDDVRYILFDYCCKNQAGAERDKLVLLSWCPETATVKKKMLHAASKNAVKKFLDIDTLPEIYCACADDVSDSEIKSKLK